MEGRGVDVENINATALKSCDMLLQLNGIRLMPCDFNLRYKKLSEYLKQISKRYGLGLEQSLLHWKDLSKDKLPLSFKALDGDYIVLAKMTNNKVLIQHPDQAMPKIISVDELKSLWSNRVIMTPRGRLNFNIKWFITEFARFKGLLGEVLILSLFLQLLALIMPLFFQVMMDKVLVHNAQSTLDVLVVVLLITGGFEIVIKGLREYLFVHTTNRIDICLGLNLFKHLLALPIAYFKSRHVGTIVNGISELDSIRNLLTGAILTLLVDVVFSLIFLSVMYYLSAKLTLIILLMLPLYFIIAYLSAKPLKKRIEQQSFSNAQNNAFLTEVVLGCETVKSLAIEPIFQRRWEEQTCEAVKTNVTTQSMQFGINQSISLLQRTTNTLVIWFGANMVINLEITIGQLVAFNMMVSHINQPMAKLTELWQQFVRTRVAMDKLGDVLNLPTESNVEMHQAVKKLSGQIFFSGVNFRYQSGLPMVLNSASFGIHAGENIGIVGSSGSGKSTITRLIQKFYVPESGEILMDNISIKDLSASYVRRQISVVLQESYLFNLSVRENIAIKYPGASFEQVVEVAKLAAAHKFILQLPKGYDTIVAESGCSLSGGQKQRIAIARALMGEPSVLIFDEATSALDDKTQKVVLSNISKFAAQITVITIAHRLSTVKHCDRILFLYKGAIAEQGTHNFLLTKNGFYARLWMLQREAWEVSDETS